MRRFIDLNNPINWSCSLNYGLAGWWLVTSKYMDDKKFVDLTKRSNGLFTNGGPSRTGALNRPGGFGSLHFVPANLQYVDTGDPPALDITGSAVTVCGWARLHTLFDGNHIIVSKHGGNHRYVLMKTGAGSNRATFGVTTSVFVSMTGSDIITKDKWFHYAGVYDGANINLYMNGAIDAAPVAQTGNIAAGDDVHIGATGGSGAPAEHWDGELDDIRIWKRALNAQEIRAVYHDSMQGYRLTLNYINRRAYFSPPTGQQFFGDIRQNIFKSFIRGAKF